MVEQMFAHLIVYYVLFAVQVFVNKQDAYASVSTPLACVLLSILWSASILYETKMGVQVESDSLASVAVLVLSVVIVGAYFVAYYFDNRRWLDAMENKFKEAV